MGAIISRRGVVATIAGAIALPLAASRESLAQGQPTRPIVGVLRGGGEWPKELRAALVQGLRDHGLEEGRDYDIAVRSTGGEPAREPALIAELVALRPAVIVAQSTGLVVGLKKATDTIPIVGATITDPIGFGLATSIAHPGGNVTGILSNSASTAKLVEVLLEIVPERRRIGALINPSNPAHLYGFPKGKAELETRSVTLIPAEARVAADIEPAFQTLAREGVQAMYVGQDTLFNQEIKKIADLALAAKLPSAYGFRVLPEAGGLMSYGTNPADHQRRSGWYAAKILKGENPGDLPIEQEAKVELVINMKTATALGLTVPPIILARADEVIE
jgi:putative tryptophan/tyrosine transport system substrate-binding protein